MPGSGGDIVLTDTSSEADNINAVHSCCIGTYVLRYAVSKHIQSNMLLSSITFCCSIAQVTEVAGYTRNALNAGLLVQDGQSSRTE